MSNITPVNISISGPMMLLPQSAAPIQEAAAQGSSNLDSQQRAIVIGEPVPIVFGKRVTKTTYKWSGDTATAINYTVGGVFVSPGATEGRFSNNATTNELSIKLHLVLSQGDMPQLQLRDVFQRACRVGTWTQTYDRRAGTWTPGNFITAVAGKELWNCPIFCGTSGYYDDLTTLSYENTHADGDQTWDRQVHCFVREGIIVDRLIEGTAGSSNNVCDLAVYLIKQSSRFPDDLIDTATFTTAANFTETQQLYYNGKFQDSQNLEDWLQDISTYFLLRVSDKNGKKAFRPRLPITDSFAIDTGIVTPVFTFSEDHLLTDGFEIEWISFADRRPTIMQMLWRQQPEDDLGIVRTSLVNISNKFDDLPIEQHDMSAFCASELHAVKVGTYLAAKRAFVSHTLRVRVKPDAFNSTLTLGDVVRVRLQRETDLDAVSWHDYFYEVERINKTLSGVVELDLMHYPIDANGRSAVALYVAAAQIKNYEYPTGRSTFTCDLPGRDDDETPLGDDGGDLPDLPDPDTDWTPIDPDGDPSDPNWPADSPTWPSDQPDPNEPNAPTVPDPSWPAGTTDPDNADNQAGNSDVSGSDNSNALGNGTGLGGDAGTGFGGGSAGVPATPNPADPIDSVSDENVGGGATITDGTGTTWPSDRQVFPGDTIKITPPCSGADIGLYVYNKITGTKYYLADGSIVYDPTVDVEATVNISKALGIDAYSPDVHELRVTYCCPDPGTTDGFAECQQQTIGDMGSATWGAASGSYRIDNGSDSFSFTTLGALAGFSVWWYSEGCSTCQAKASISWFDANGDFQVQRDIFGQGCVNTSTGFIGKLYKQVDGVFTFQNDLFATALCPFEPPGGAIPGTVYWYPATPGQTPRVIFSGYIGEWLLGIGSAYGWVLYAQEVNYGGGVQYYEAGINASGGLVSIDCIPVTLANNCQAVNPDTELTFTLDGVPFTPNSV